MVHLTPGTGQDGTCFPACLRCCCSWPGNVYSCRCLTRDYPPPPGHIDTPSFDPGASSVDQRPPNSTEPPYPLSPPSPVVGPVTTYASPSTGSGSGSTGIGNVSYIAIAALVVAFCGCFYWRRRRAAQCNRRNRKRRRSEWVPQGNGYCSDSDASSEDADAAPPNRRSDRKRQKAAKRYRRSSDSDASDHQQHSDTIRAQHGKARKAPISKHTSKHGKKGTSRGGRTHQSR